MARSRFPRGGLSAFAKGLGSLLDLWPAKKYEDVYPYKAEDVLRRSWERVAAAMGTALGDANALEMQRNGPSAADAKTADAKTANDVGDRGPRPDQRS